MSKQIERDKPGTQNDASRALTSSVCLSHAPGARPVAAPHAPACSHALLLLPCVFWNFPIFYVNTYYIPKPYPPSTIRISSWFLLQIYRSPYYDSNKPYFITHYTIWTKISRFKSSVIWVFRYLCDNRLNQLSSELQWLKSLHNRLPILRFARCHNKRQRTLRFCRKTRIITFSVFCFPLPLFLR